MFIAYLLYMKGEVKMTISLGTKIKELRTLKGMSQDELGKKIGVQRAAINKYEKGLVENIPLKTIEKIAEVLNVSPMYLVGWKKDMFDALSLEVRVIQGMHYLFGQEGVDIVEMYTSLNQTGRERVYQYVTDMSMVYSNGEGEKE